MTKLLIEIPEEAKMAIIEFVELHGGRILAINLVPYPVDDAVSEYGI